MFLGRLQEMAFLKKLHMRGGKKLILISGSQGVGKTELAVQLLSTCRSLYLLPNGFGEKGIVEYFWSQMIASGIGSRFNAPSSYADIFNIIRDESATEGLLVIIDSLQDIISQSRKFIPDFNAWWGSLPLSQNLTIIVLSSSPAVPGPAELRSKNSIYSIATEKMVLNDLTYAEVLPIFSGLTPEEAVTAYSVFGGCPNSIAHFNPRINIERNIEENILSKTSYLYNYSKFTFISNAKNRVKLFAILQRMGFGHKSLEELATETGIPKSEIQSELRILESKYGIVEKSGFVTSKQAGVKNLFSIKDNYTRFWFSFVYPNLGLLEQGKIKEVKNAIQLGLDRHTANAFREICFRHLRNFIVNRGENLQYYEWRSTSSHVDIVGIDKETLDAYFVEVHWTQSPLMKDSVESLSVKSAELQWMRGKRKNHLIIYSKSGFRFETNEAQLINLQTLQRDLSSPEQTGKPQ